MREAFQDMISERRAGMGALVILALLLLFHVLVLVGVVPADVVWGGQFGGSPDDLIVFEFVALAVTLLFGIIILMKLNVILRNRAPRATRAGLWIMFGYFMLNVVGNLSTGVSAESIIFGPVSIVLALLVLRLAIAGENGRGQSCYQGRA